MGRGSCMSNAPSTQPVLVGITQPRWLPPIAGIILLPGVVGLFAGIDGLRGKHGADEIVGVVGIGCFVISFAIIIVFTKLLARRLQVDAGGVEVRTRSGKVTRIQWSEPHEVYYRAISGALAPRVERASVRTPDGRRIDVDNVRIPGNPNAGVPNLVERYSTAASWPSIHARLHAGEDVVFGAVRLNRERLKIGLLSHPLGRPLRLDIDRGLIQVQAEGKWLSSKVWVRDVANYPCLLRAVGELTPKA